VDLARDYELEDLVDIKKKRPVNEILLPKPEKPNPLALFPSLLLQLSPEVLKQVVLPSPEKDDVPTDSEPPRTLIRNETIEDDALIHLNSAQAAGWKLRLSTHNIREREWRSQRQKVLALRRWINTHVDPVFAGRIHDIQCVREAVETLRRSFPEHLEQNNAREAYREITEKAGADLDVHEWFRQWRLAYWKACWLGLPETRGLFAADQFLEVVKRYSPRWVLTHRVLSGKHPMDLPDLIDEFHNILAAGSLFYFTEPWESPGQKGDMHECPCSDGMVPHNPKECWYVKAALGVPCHKRRRLNETRLDNTRDELALQKWSRLVSVVCGTAPS